MKETLIRRNYLVLHVEGTYHSNAEGRPLRFAIPVEDIAYIQEHGISEPGQSTITNKVGRSWTVTECLDDIIEAMKK